MFSFYIFVVLNWVACSFILRETGLGAKLSSCVCLCDVEFQLLWTDWNLISKDSLCLLGIQNVFLLPTVLASLQHTCGPLPLGWQVFHTLNCPAAFCNAIHLYWGCGKTDCGGFCWLCHTKYIGTMLFLCYGSFGSVWPRSPPSCCVWDKIDLWWGVLQRWLQKDWFNIFHSGCGGGVQGVSILGLGGLAQSGLRGGLVCSQQVCKHDVILPER